MKKYVIKETLEKCGAAENPGDPYQYVAVLNSEEWKLSELSFDVGIELDFNLQKSHATKAEVNYDSLTGTFVLPNPDDPRKGGARFAFVIDEKGVVFIDDEHYAEQVIENIRRTRKWKLPSLERFLYDFLECVIMRDSEILSQYETELSKIETDIYQGGGKNCSVRLNEIRNDIRILYRHYEQLIDLGQELTENENGFFKEMNLRYFHLFTSRVERLIHMISTLREYTSQLRELYESQLSIKQNHIVTVLTMVTSIFMPLTLVVGWYGMNFVHMPELKSTWGYPAVAVACVLIVVSGLLFFRRKKWL